MIASNGRQLTCCLQPAMLCACLVYCHRFLAGRRFIARQINTNHEGLLLPSCCWSQGATWPHFNNQPAALSCALLLFVSLCESNSPSQLLRPMQTLGASLHNLHICHHLFERSITVLSATGGIPLPSASGTCAGHDIWPGLHFLLASGTCCHSALQACRVVHSRDGGKPARRGRRSSPALGARRDGRCPSLALMTAWPPGPHRRFPKAHHTFNH
jgi:hypothetical protein